MTMASTGDNSRAALIAALNGTLADYLALYVKTKNFHWHVAGPRFRDLHLMFDEQAAQLIAQVDLIGERVRKNGAATLTSIGAVGGNTVIANQDSTTLDANTMVAELQADNQTLLGRLRAVKQAAEEAGDYATSGAVDGWIDEAEERVWFLGQVLK